MNPRIYLFCLFFISAGTLHAQLNIGGQFVIPADGFGDHIRASGGAVILMEFPVVKRVSIIGHFDYIYWTVKPTRDNPSNIGLSTVALQAGLRFYGSRKLYMQAMGGVISIFAKLKIYGIETLGQEDKAAWAVGPGILLGPRTDFNVQLQAMDKLRFVSFQLAHRFGGPNKKWPPKAKSDN